MAEDRMMTAADVVAKAMGGEHGDLLRDAVVCSQGQRVRRGAPRSHQSGSSPSLSHPGDHVGVGIAGTRYRATPSRAARRAALVSGSATRDQPS
jgi:hypothetical protein